MNIYALSSGKGPSGIAIVRISGSDVLNICKKITKLKEIKSAEVKVVNVFQEVKWYFPKLKFGHIISVPLGDGENPDCLYFAKDINQLPDTMDVGSFF